MAWLGIGFSASTEFTRFDIARTWCDNVSMPKQPFTVKVCPGCQVEKSRSDYYKKGTTVSHKCKECTKVDLRQRAPNYFGKYRENENEWRRNKYKTDPAYRNKIASQKKAVYEARKSEINAARRLRWETDPSNPARFYFRRKDIKGRTPPWVSKEAIIAIYASCPKGKEVDHIIPLKGLIDGRPVSGLHVPWNLQYLTPTQNRKKKNRITEITVPATLFCPCRYFAPQEWSCAD
jgi:hypothetical protein